jgi:hypothetical protein
MSELAAALDEVRRLVGAGHVDRAVVADEADRLAVDARLHGERLRAVQRLELDQLDASAMRAITSRMSTGWRRSAGISESSSSAS